MERLRLPINATKTRCLRVPEEPMEFLGYWIGRSYRSIERILREKADRLPLEGMGAPTGSEPLGHGNVRGGSYYRTTGSREGRGGDEC